MIRFESPSPLSSDAKFTGIGLSGAPFRVVLFLFLAGFAARLVVTAFMADNRTLYSEHMIIARNLLDGLGYSWHEWGRMALQPTSPLLPFCVYWCAVFQWLSAAPFSPMYSAQAVVAGSAVLPACMPGKHVSSASVRLIFTALNAAGLEFVLIHSDFS